MKRTNAGSRICRRPRRARISRTSRNAFTLIEVILALALTAVLLSAIYAAIDLYGRLVTAGRKDVERALLARSILRRIERDLHSTIFRESEAVTTTTAEEGSSTSGTGSESVATAADGTAIPDVTTAYTAAGGGLFGDPSSLILHVSRPSRDLNYALIGDGTGGLTSDLLSISWFVASANASGLQGAVGNLAAGGSAVSSDAVGVQGLARLEGDRLAVTMADQAGQLADLAQGTELVAREVNYIQFSYFDGLSWWDTWDSVSMGGLPLAVEVVIGFGPQPEDAMTPTATTTSTTAADPAGLLQIEETYRLVIALPIAEPYVPVTTEF